MTGGTLFLIVVLGILTVTSLAFSILMIWWTRSSQGQHSISAVRAQERYSEAQSKALMDLAAFQRQATEQSAVMATQAAEMAFRVTDRAADIVRIQANLTEMLLLGRPTQPIELSQPSASTSETSVDPSLLWDSLPEGAREAIARDRAEAVAWPNHSETLLDPSANGLPPDGVSLEMDGLLTDPPTA